MKPHYFLTLLLALATPAIAQSTQSSEPALGKLFRSRVGGIEFNPPASGTQSTAKANGEIVRFVNVEQSWDLRVKAIPLHTGMTLLGVHDDGVLSLIKTQLTDANPTAEILCADVVSKRQICNGAPFGLIESRYDSATDRIFSQQAIFPDTTRDDNRYYLIVQMTSHGKPKTDTTPSLNAEEASIQNLFRAVLSTVHILDRAQLRREQENRINNTRMFWLGLNEQKFLSVLDPLHFVRFVQDGKDVGFMQINEQAITKSGGPGFEIIVHSQLQASLVKPTDAPTKMTGITPKKDGPSYYYTSSSFFVTFDRKHEGWTTVTQLGSGDDAVKSQTTESANSDQTLRRKLNIAQQALEARTTPTTKPKGSEPPVLEISDYMLDVAYATGPHQDKPTDIKLPPYYLPQAVSQLLPRLLPNEPAKYMFAFYVSGQRNVLARYVDVDNPREVELGDQNILAIPITDRIGADGPVTMHYVTRDGKWLGSATPDAHLQMLPTDETTLKSIWPGFVVNTQPAIDAPVQNQPELSR